MRKQGTGLQTCRCRHLIMAMRIPAVAKPQKTGTNIRTRSIWACQVKPEKKGDRHRTCHSKDIFLATALAFCPSTTVLGETDRERV